MAPTLLPLFAGIPTAPLHRVDLLHSEQYPGSVLLQVGLGPADTLPRSLPWLTSLAAQLPMRRRFELRLHVFQVLVRLHDSSATLWDAKARTFGVSLRIEGRHSTRPLNSIVIRLHWHCAGEESECCGLQRSVRSVRRREVWWRCGEDQGPAGDHEPRVVSDPDAHR